jgi:hypothetical protein
MGRTGHALGQVWSYIGRVWLILQMVYIIVQDDKMVDRLRAVCAMMAEVLNAPEGGLVGLHNKVNCNDKVGFVIQLTSDIYYLRCAELKISVDDQRGLSYCFALRWPLA